MCEVRLRPMWMLLLLHGCVIQTGYQTQRWHRGFPGEIPWKRSLRPIGSISRHTIWKLSKHFTHNYIGARGRVGGHQSPLIFILWGPWMPLQNFMTIHLILVQCRCSWSHMRVTLAFQVTCTQPGLHGCLHFANSAVPLVGIFISCHFIWEMLFKWT